MDKTDLPEFHPLHDEVVAEAFARPSVAIKCPAMATRISLSQPPGTNFHDFAADHLAMLCREKDLACPPKGARHHVVSSESWTLVWERHTEFVSVTIIEKDRTGIDWQTTPLRLLPIDWIRSLPGKTLSIEHIAIIRTEYAKTDLERAALAFGHSDFSAARAANDTLTVAADFRPDEDGAIRMIIFDTGARPDYLGRLTQRLFEIDFYRLAALLALPTARHLSRSLTTLEARLDIALASLAGGLNPQNEQPTEDIKDEDLLATISTIAAEIERLEHETRYRFEASTAYYQIVKDRVERLRETRIEGHQRIGTFMDHRLAPAMRTCLAASGRLEHLSARVGRALDLLTTKISVAVEQQNAQRLQSLNTRTETQLRLQETVEGLSTVAISYYAVGLIQYGLKALHDAGGPDIVTVGTGIAIPIVLAAVYLGVRAMKKKIAEHPPGDDD